MIERSISLMDKKSAKGNTVGTYPGPMSNTQCFLLKGREETCINNCVERFVDTTMLVTKR